MDMSAAELEIYQQVKPFTMTTVEKVIASGSRSNLDRRRDVLRVRFEELRKLLWRRETVVGVECGSLGPRQLLFRTRFDEGASWSASSRRDDRTVTNQSIPGTRVNIQLM
jgi:hypothetical protein